MDKAVLSLAILKVNLDHLQKDYIEVFIPFLATLIIQKGYERIIDINQLGKDFEAEYDLLIPPYALKAILTRARKKGIVKLDEDMFVPVPVKARKYDFSKSSEIQEKRQVSIIEKLITFCKEKHQENMTTEEAEDLFHTFLKEHDIEILFAAEGVEELPKVTHIARKKYLIYSFIKHTQVNDLFAFAFIVDIAIGHVLASALIYERFVQYTGDLRNVGLYLDTRFILRLLGVEGKEQKEACVEFLKSYREKKAKLFLFEHTYDEVTGILRECIRWVGNKDYDPRKASPALRFFVENNFTKSDVEEIIVTAPEELKAYNIEITAIPDPNLYSAWQIDTQACRRLCKLTPGEG